MQAYPGIDMLFKRLNRLHVKKMKNQYIKVSKFLSFVLRHRPERIGLTLDQPGWASVEELIRLSSAAGRHFTRELIAEVMATNDKQRFALSLDGQRIRANQGHSSLSTISGLNPLIRHTCSTTVRQPGSLAPSSPMVCGLANASMCICLPVKPPP
jgi:RNA:NAD 2'-phosphotransferase (TPT1/KptA family)